jgi:tetratricopeptide (TPR) repeat protein
LAVCVASARAQSQKLLETIEEDRAQIQAAEREHLSEEHQAYLWANLAADYRLAADFSHSEGAYDRSIQMLKDLPDSRTNYATVLDNLGALYLTYARKEEASTCMKKALAIRQQLGDKVNIAISLQHIADLDVARHKYKDAEREADEASPALLANVDTNGSSAVAVLSTLAYARCRLNRCAQGLEDAQHALALARTILPSQSLRFGLTLLVLGYVEWRSGQPQDAEINLLQGLDIVKKQTEPGDPILVYSMMEYRAYLTAMHRGPEVKALNAQLANMQRPCSNCSVSVHSLSNAMR